MSLARYPPPHPRTLLLNLSLPATKGNKNANRKGTIEGDVDVESFTDCVYWTNRYLIDNLGPKYTLRDFDTWSNETLNPEWAMIKNDKAFHWNSPSAMSQCFNDRATKAGYPQSFLTFHSLRKSLSETEVTEDTTDLPPPLFRLPANHTQRLRFHTQSLRTGSFVLEPFTSIPPEELGGKRM